MIITATDWRRGLIAVLLVGVMQDVFRKLTAGAPVYYTLWSTAVYAIVVFAVFAQRALPSPISQLFLRTSNVRIALVFFLIMVAIQCINSLLRYNNPLITILGGMFYIGPLVAMLIAIGFVDSERRLRQFLLAYLIIFIPTCLTVFLSPTLSMQFPVLRDIGTFIGRELVIYDVGTKLASHPGILRVGELAAWHAATCIAFLSIFTLLSRLTVVRVMNVGLMILMIGVIVLTGRRKMLAATTIFFAAQWGMLLWYRFGIRRIGVMMAALSIAFVAMVFVYEPSEETSYYLQRSQTVYASVEERLELTWNLVSSAVSASEVFGLGAGVTSQGARFAGKTHRASGAAESGLGKVVVELGVLGFLLLAILVTVSTKEIFSSLGLVKNLDNHLLLYQVSFLAFLLSNLATFAVASQLFGDLFVLIILGTIAGFVVRIHNLSIDAIRYDARLDYS